MADDVIDPGDLNGGQDEGGEEKRKPPKPLLGKKVTIGNQEFEVSDEMAAALEAQQEMFQQQASAMQENLLAEFRKVTPPSNPRGEEDTVEGDDDFKFLTEPTKYLKEQLNEFRQGLITEIKQMDQSRNQLQVFWDGFYKERPELKDHDAIVRTVFEANKTQWGNLTFAQTWKKLGAAVDKTIDSFLKGRTLDPDGDRTDIEGGHGQQPAPSKKVSDEEKEAREWHLVDSLRKAKNDREKRLAKSGH